MSDRTEEIRARVEKASCGPWQVIRKGDSDNDWLLATFGAASDDDRLVELHTKGVRGDGLSSAENDAEFCAHARTDIPDLLTELQKVEADRNRYIQRAGSAEGRLEVMEAELQALREENARLKGDDWQFLGYSQDELRRIICEWKDFTVSARITRTGAEMKKIDDLIKQCVGLVMVKEPLTAVQLESVRRWNTAKVTYAVYEALELAAQEALALADDESNVGIAERIRALKSPAQEPESA